MPSSSGRGDSWPAMLRVLEPSIVLQINRDAGHPPGVTSDGVSKPAAFGPLPNRGPGVVSIKSSSGHRCSQRINALEEGLPALKTSDHNIFV